MIIAPRLLSVAKPITLKNQLLWTATDKLVIDEILRLASYSVKLKEENLFWNYKWNMSHFQANKKGNFLVTVFFSEHWCEVTHVSLEKTT